MKAEADALATLVFFGLLLFFVRHHTIPSTTAAGLSEGRHHICTCGSQSGRNGDRKRKAGAGCAVRQQRSLFSKYKSLQVAFKVMSS